MIRFLIGLVLSASPVFAQNAPPAYAPSQSTTDEIQSLKDRLSRLESTAAPLNDQVNQMRLEQLLPDPLGSGFTGLGPAASKIYTSKNPIAIGAVGELTYQNSSAENAVTNIENADVLLGARISQKIIFNSAFSLETKSSNQLSGTRVHYAYVDFLLAQETGLRVGNFLVPFGETNLRFEPTLYPMVNRPLPETLIIPSDWNENGLLGFYRTKNWLIQLGLMNSGQIANVNADTWLRNGRQAGAGAGADSMAWVARIETNSASLPSGRPRPSIGLSVYGGSWAQGDHARFANSDVLMGEIHAGLNIWRLKAQGQFVEGHLSDADRVSTALSKGISSRARGAVAILSFDLLPPAAQRAASILGVDQSPFYHELPIFVSYEFADAQADVPMGYTPDPKSRASIWTFGVNYLPHEQFILKGDVAIRHDRNNFESRAFEAGLGVTF